MFCSFFSKLHPLIAPRKREIHRACALILLLCQQRVFCCACSVKFSLIRETAGMRQRRFPAQESRKKRSRKIRRKKQWFEYLRQPFFSFSFCYLDGSGIVLKLLCDVWKEVIFKMVKIVQTTSSRVL